MRRPLLVPAFAALGLLLGACADAPQPTSPTTPRPAALGSGPAALTVMSRNMYLGANIDPLIVPNPDPGAVQAAFAQLLHTDYPVRAQYLAAEIVARMPDAVGLQEVTRYVLPDGTVLDFLDVLQQYLAGMGATYHAAVRQNNVQLLIPLDNAGHTVTYTDGDAILVRDGVTYGDDAAGHYPSQQSLKVGNDVFKNLRGWNAVTLHVNGADYRFVNTHLEIQMFRDVQEAQARELAGLLAGETLPVVLVGDFNSAANPSAPSDSKTGTYHILRNAGFADLELREPHSSSMVTCCHAANLTDAVPTFDQRLDLVFARMGQAGFGGQSTVDVVASPQFDDPHGYKLWPSDHAAVFARLWPAPGLMR